MPGKQNKNKNKPALTALFRSSAWNILRDPAPVPGFGGVFGRSDEGIQQLRWVKAEYKSQVFKE